MDAFLSKLIVFLAFKEILAFVVRLILGFFTFALFFCFFGSVKCSLELMKIMRTLRLLLLVAFLSNLCQFLAITMNHDYSLFRKSMILFLCFSIFCHFFRVIWMLCLEFFIIVLITLRLDGDLLHETLHDLWFFYLEIFKA